MRRLGLLVGSLLALTAFGEAGGHGLGSGVAGKVVAGPTCPVERVPPQPGCAPRPLAVALRVRSVVRGGSATTVHSGADGRFRVGLAPGSYVVQALGRRGSPYPRPPAPLRVDVRFKRFTNITITYDTGIR